MSKKLYKPAPYLVQADGYPIKEGAKWLRTVLKPLMAKKLPTVYYAGFAQNCIPQFVKDHKAAYPYFLKVDISKFYAAVCHHKLYIEALLGYKKMVGKTSVPRSFKNRFEPLYLAFIGGLLVKGQGLPLNSSMSKTLAPIMYVNFF